MRQSKIKNRQCRQCIENKQLYMYSFFIKVINIYRIQMKILITGGTGFIGSNLCSYLLSEGHTVICLDNNFTGRMVNVEQHLENPNFKFILHDVVEPFNFDIKVDQIYHLACPASPPAYQLDPIKTIQTNVNGTFNVLNYANKYNATVLLSSTSEVYGDPMVNPQPETYWGNVNTIGPRSCYDEGKRIAETIMMEYHHTHKTNIRIARIFNTYGPNMDKNDGRVVSNFINQCLENTEITIYGDGSQTRSLCYVTDLISGLVKLMNNNITNGPINLGNPCEQTVSSIGEYIKRVTNSSSKIVYCPLPKDDPMRRQPNIEKAKKILDWMPRVSFEEGIQKTIHYFQNYK